MVTRSVGDWVVHTCSCCNCDAYLLHSVKEGDRVFVTKQLLVCHCGAVLWCMVAMGDQECNIVEATAGSLG